MTAALLVGVVGSGLPAGAPAAAGQFATAIDYQAEDAVIHRGQVESNHADFTGAGFVNYRNQTGSYVEWTVDATEADSFVIAFVYANGTSANRSMDIAVNGALTAENLAFGGTGSWSTWQSSMAIVKLDAGNNTIRATAVTSSGGPNVDKLSLVEPFPIDYQAEDAVIHRGLVESDHADFSGAGFVNYRNETGSYVEWTVDVAEAGGVLIAFRYANGTSTNRPMDIAVNGALVVNDLAFDRTGSWSSWQARTTNVTLDAGSNIIRATAVTSNGGPNVDRLTVLGVDWSTAVVESTMERYEAKELGATTSRGTSWGYTRGLYLYGQYLVYQRTQDQGYLDYIQSWVDCLMDDSGTIRLHCNDKTREQKYDTLDSMQPGNVLLVLSQDEMITEPDQTRYKEAAEKIWEELRTYPSTSDGGWWHATADFRKGTRVGQLWADGVFMVNPFVIRYGNREPPNEDDKLWGNDESANQLLIYHDHLKRTGIEDVDDEQIDTAGLLYHAYDETPDRDDPDHWAHAEYDNTNGVSWCRAIGWYGTAAINVLDLLPPNHDKRDELIEILRDLVDAFDRYQDPKTGLWFQVVTHRADRRNWRETSCSAMYTFIVSRAVEQGYVDAGYREVARKGYKGVLTKVSLGSDGLTQISDTSQGTNVGDTEKFYYGRRKETNDLHGLGAFLIMNEQMISTGGG